jgi:hypothetical protein
MPSPPPTRVEPPRVEFTVVVDPGRIVLTIDGWRPTLANELKRHPFVAAGAKKRDADLLTLIAQSQRLPRAVGKRRLSVVIRNRFGRLPDHDAPLKSLFDALVQAQLLVDDSDEWLDFEWPPRYVRGPLQTVIRLEDV